MNRQLLKSILIIIDRWAIRFVFGFITLIWLFLIYVCLTPPATDCYDASQDMSTTKVIIIAIIHLLLFCFICYLTRDRGKRVKDNSKEPIKDPNQNIIVVGNSIWPRLAKYYNGNEYGGWITLYDGAKNTNGKVLISKEILFYLSDKKTPKEGTYLEVRFIIDGDNTGDKYILKLQRISSVEDGVGYKVCEINDPDFKDLMGKECWFYIVTGIILGVLKNKPEYIYIREIIV